MKSKLTINDKKIKSQNISSIELSTTSMCSLGKSQNEPIRFDSTSKRTISVPSISKSENMISLPNNFHFHGLNNNRNYKKIRKGELN
jgi:hypothetical protein